MERFIWFRGFCLRKENILKGLLLYFLITLCLKNLLFFTLGMVAMLLLLIYAAMVIDCTPRSRRRVPMTTVFLQLNSWESVEREVSSCNSEEIRVVSLSFLLSECLEEIIDLIIEEFISSWLESITSSTFCQENIRKEMIFITQNIIRRLENFDFSDILVNTLVPILTRHFNEFVSKVDELKASDSSKLPRDSEEFMVSFAKSFHKGKLHPGVTKSISFGENSKEKKYLRRLLGLLLPYLLSSRNGGSEITVLLLREVLACTLLLNLVMVVSEGDFYNQLVLNLIGETMRRRLQVKQLRAALIAYTQDRFTKRKAKSSDAGLGKDKAQVLRIYEIYDGIDTESFNDILKNISNIPLLEELIELKTHYERMLVSLISSIPKNADDTPNKLKTAILLILEKLKHTASGFKSSSLESILELGKKVLLHDVLSNEIALQSFKTYLETRHELHLLTSWQAIERIKAPLEDGESDLSLSWGFNNKEEIKHIYTDYIMTDDSYNFSIKKKIEKYINSGLLETDSTSMQEARKVLFGIQMEIYIKLEDLYQEFKQSSLFLGMLLTNPFNWKLQREDPVSFSMVASAYNDKSELTTDDFSEGETNDANPAVVKAVENAFTEIMQTRGEEQAASNLELSTDSLSSSTNLEVPNKTISTVKTIDLRKDLFGEDSSIFCEKHEDNEKTKERKLFDDSFDVNSDSEFNEDSGSSQVSLSDGPMLDLNLFLAAPGDLRLTEKISVLTHEMERLYEQQNILKPLIKKAELTNNSAELRVLKKSMANLEREISWKKLQKQQYIVQESDNSLYGKSEVRIQTYISDSDHGKPFTFYIVEVQRTSTEDENTVAAGWVVARRFSQFFKLNEYLKSRYTEVNRIKFPKRVVQVLNFQAKQIIEQRRKMLEEYLQALITIPEVCSDRIFRSFLSSENFNLKKNQLFDDNTKHQAKSHERSRTRLYHTIAGRLSKQNSAQIASQTAEADLELLRDMQKELKQFEECAPSQNQAKPAFAKSICDLLITVFNLNSTTSIRGKALVLILQQVFGTTIEKKFNDLINSYLRDEESIIDLASKIKILLFPDGKFKAAAPLRSSFQKANTKHNAKSLLRTFMQETCGKVFGMASTNYAHEYLFELFQNDILNRHLIFTILDEFFEQLFPELKSNIG